MIFQCGYLENTLKIFWLLGRNQERKAIDCIGTRGRLSVLQALAYWENGGIWKWIQCVFSWFSLHCSWCWRLNYSFYCFYFTSTKYSSLYFLRKTQLSIVLPDSGYFLNLYEINILNVSHDKVCSSSRGKMRTDCFINVTIHYCTHIFTKSNDKVIYFFVYVDTISRQCSILSK